MDVGNKKKKMENLREVVLNPEALHQLIETLDEKEDYEELIKVYELLLENNPQDINALIELAIIYADNFHNYDKANDYLNQVLNIDPNNAEAYFHKGRIIEKWKEDYEEARNNYLKAIALDNHLVDGYLNLSWLYLEHFNDVNTSYIVIQEGLKYNEDSNLYTQLAYIEYHKYHELAKAQEHLTKAIELDSENDLAYTYLGQIYLDENQFDQAKDTFAKAFSLPNINEVLIHEYSRLLILVYRDIDGAIEVFKKAIEHFPDNVIYYAYLANLYFITGNTYQAKYYLREAESFTIDDQEALLMIGYLKVMMDNDKEGALMYFEKVIELNPTNINALSFIGFYNLVNTKEVDKALEYFKKIASLSHDNLAVHFIIAQIYLQHYNDVQKAIDHLLSVDTSHLDVQEICQLYFLIGNIFEKFERNNHKALEYYEKAYQLKPDKYLEDIINRLYELDKTLIN